MRMAPEQRLLNLINKGEFDMARKSRYFAAGADIPKHIKQRTYWYMRERCMSLGDAFTEAVRDCYNEAPVALQQAWDSCNMRDYIPFAYNNSIE